MSCERWRADVHRHRKENQDPDWKLFPHHGVEWPVDLAVVARSICLGGLTHREAELAYFSDKNFPRSAELGDAYEFMNIVPKKDRVLAKRFTAEHVPKRSGPWLLNPRTLTGSMKLLTRYMVDGVQVVR